MRRQFLGELERMQAKIREKEEVINQLQQENIDIDQFRSTIRTLEDKLCEKENHIAKLKNELEGNDIKVTKVKTDVSDDVVSDDNEGDGYRVDLDFIKILVDVETDTRALVEKEKTIYAPFSGVGGIVYDKDAVYIDLGGAKWATV